MHKKVTSSAVVVILAFILGACSSSSSKLLYTIEDPTDLLVDEYFFDELIDSPSVEQPDLFELPSSYRQDLDRIIASTDTEYERYQKMRKWIYRHFRNYDFDVTETYSLGQLNTNRKINCLSFSVLFVAVARYVNVPADFQLVLAPPYWDKDGGNWINNQHINVTGTVKLGNAFHSATNSITSFDAQRLAGSLYLDAIDLPQYKNSLRYTADINPAVLSINSGRKKITEQQVLSLFYSNKAIEALIDHELTLAYAYTKSALGADPNSAVAWNNLGVLYAKVNQQQLSIATYERAIRLDDSQYSAKSNLANSYRSAGRNLEATLIEQEIETFRNQNPYYHSALAQSSIMQGDLQTAMKHLEQAVAQKHNEQFFYHQMAIVNQRLGNSESVVNNLTRARRYAHGPEKMRYAGKLKALEELAVLAN